MLKFLAPWSRKLSAISQCHISFGPLISICFICETRSSMTMTAITTWVSSPLVSFISMCVCICECVFVYVCVLIYTSLTLVQTDKMEIILIRKWLNGIYSNWLLSPNDIHSTRWDCDEHTWRTGSYITAYWLTPDLWYHICYLSVFIALNSVLWASRAWELEDCKRNERRQIFGGKI